MGDIELPKRQPVAHIRPGNILDEIERKAFAFRETEFGRSNQDGCVDKGNKAGAQDFLPVAADDCRCLRYAAV